MTTGGGLTVTVLVEESVFPSLSVTVREDLRLPILLGDPVDIEVREKTTESMPAYRHYLAGLDLLDEAPEENFNQPIKNNSEYSKHQ